jgi:hypothetical protein
MLFYVGMLLLVYRDLSEQTMHEHQRGSSGVPLLKANVKDIRSSRKGRKQVLSTEYL